MSKSKHAVSYLQVVHGNMAPDFTPPRPDGVSESDWFIFLHADEITQGVYDYWLLHSGLCLSDAELKAQGLIPTDWCVIDDPLFIRRHAVGPITDSTPLE